MGGCSAINCSNHSSHGHRMVRFPKNEERRRIWIRNCRRKDWVPGPSAQLCIYHFDESQFESKCKNGKKLRANAVPTLFDFAFNYEKQTKAHRRCCVPGCLSNRGYSDFTRVFTFPHDPEMRMKWRTVINRPDLKITSSSVVCIKHFEDKFIERYHRVIRPDGTVLIEPRKHAVLMADAYPTIFSSNQSSSLSLELAEGSISGQDDESSNEDTIIERIYVSPSKNDGANTVLLLSSHGDIASKALYFLKRGSKNADLPIQPFSSQDDDSDASDSDDSDSPIEPVLLEDVTNPHSDAPQEVEKHQPRVISNDHSSSEIKSCCVKNCNSHLENTTDIVLHKFPLSNRHLTRKWIENIGQKNFIPKVHPVVCSKHFTVGSYLNGCVSERNLKSCAFPTVFEFCDKIKDIDEPVNKRRRVSEDCTSEVPSDESAKSKPDISQSTNDSVPSSYSEEVDDSNSSCNEENMLTDFSDDDDDDDESSSNGEKLILEFNATDSKELLLEKLSKLTKLYQSSQDMYETKLEEYKQRCKRYVKEIKVLRRVVNNLKQINSLTDGCYFEDDSLS